MATADRDARSLAGTPVLVTGARGFLGTHLCPKLVAAGADVVAVSRGAQRADGDGIRWRQCDLEDVAQARLGIRSRRAPARILADRLRVADPNRVRDEPLPERLLQRLRERRHVLRDRQPMYLLKRRHLSSSSH